MDYLNEELSACESVIMKVIWDAKEDIAVQEIIQELGIRFDKHYARTTVVTFLHKMAEKGYVSTYRKGKAAYVHAEKSEREYKNRLLEEQTNFWFGGKPSKLIASLCESQKLSKDEVKKIMELLEDVDE